MSDKFRKVLFHCVEKESMTYISKDPDGNYGCKKCSEDEYVCDFAIEQYENDLDKEDLSYDEENIHYEEIKK